MGRRNKYSKDYESQIIKQGNKTKTNLVYKGNYYSYNLSEKKYQRLKWSYLFFDLLFLATFIFIGCLNTIGSRQIYIILPYLFTFLPIFYEIMGTITLMKTKAKLTYVEYDTSVLRIKRSTIGILVFSVSSAIGEVIFLVLNRNSNISNLEYMFLSGVLFMSVSSFLFLQLQSKYKCSEVVDGPMSER